MAICCGVDGFTAIVTVATGVLTAIGARAITVLMELQRSGCNYFDSELAR